MLLSGSGVQLHIITLQAVESGPRLFFRPDLKDFSLVQLRIELCLVPTVYCAQMAGRRREERNLSTCWDLPAAALVAGQLLQVDAVQHRAQGLEGWTPG